MEDMSEFSDAEIQRYRRKIGIIFQDYELINSLTPKQNVIYPLVLAGTSINEIKKRYDTVNNLLDISSIET
jgi:ABC-type methionine transport system ATPase subunit